MREGEPAGVVQNGAGARRLLCVSSELSAVTGAGKRCLHVDGGCLFKNGIDMCK